jgi:hypothetical protein
MKRLTPFSFVICSLLLSACATHTRAVTPVNLTVTSDTVNKRFVEDVRNATLDAIRTQVPAARPMTLVVNLDVSTEMRQGPFFIPYDTNRQRVLPSGPQPWTEGALPTVPVYSGSTFPQTTEDIEELRVSYTINDAAGRVVESHQIKVDPRAQHLTPTVVTGVGGFGNGDPFSARRQLVAYAAGFLASRVAAVSK